MKLTRTSALLLSAFSVLSWLSADAQSTGNGKITGTIIDSSTNQPVEFATIALVDPATNKPVDGTVADEKGKFTIPKVAEGTYKVTVSFIGYETYSQDVAITDRKGTVDMGTVKLGGSVTELNEVVVEGERALVEEKVDRTIYNAENDATTRGGDAADVLRRVPMLTVDMDGNVSLRGNQNIKVLINNKPSTITASSVADALKQIPADQIKTVEVITSPSAKYDAEGSAGIINIITKKTTMQGFTLGVDTNVGLRGSHLGLNGNLRTGKMGFSLGGFGRANYNVTGNYLNQQLTQKSDGTTAVNRQEASTRNQGLFGNYNLGWDYDINKKNSLVASVRFGTRNGRNFQDGLLTQSFNNDALVSSSLQDVDVKDLSGNVDGALTYTKTFDVVGREFSLLGSYSQNNRTNDFVNNYLDQTDMTVTSRRKNNNNSYNREVTFQADYQTPLFKNNILEFGGKNIARQVNSKYQYYNATGADGPYVPNLDPRLSNSFDYHQNVTAGYMSYTALLPKGYSLKAGGRYEYTTIDANFVNEQVVDIPSYGVLVPSANLSKKLKNGTAKVAYNRRIQRPSLQYLNPNIQSQNLLMPTVGNPMLGPEYTNNYEVSYSTFLKIASLNFSAFVRNTNDAIQSVRDTVNVNGQQGVSTTYANIGREDAYGGSLFASLTISDKFTLNGGTDVYYAVLNNNSPNPSYAASNQGWVASGRLFGNYKLTKLWALQFFSFYRGNQVQLQGSQSGFAMYSLSLKRDFANKRGSVGFGAENFFNFNGFTFRNETVSPVFIQKSTNTINNMSFKVNFSIRLGKMSFDQRQPRRRSINNDDLKQGGDGNGAGMDGGQQGNGNGNAGVGLGTAGSGRPAGAAPAAVMIAKGPAVDPSAVINAAGTWTYTVDSPQGGNGTIVIIKEGETYTGTMTNARFNRENQLKEIVVKGNEISFGYDANFGGNASTVTVKGTIAGDALTGVMNVGQFGSFPISAKRTN